MKTLPNPPQSSKSNHSIIEVLEFCQALKDVGFRWPHSCGLHSRPARNYRPWDKYTTISLDKALTVA